MFLSFFRPLMEKYLIWTNLLNETNMYSPAAKVLVVILTAHMAPSALTTTTLTDVAVKILPFMASFARKVCGATAEIRFLSNTLPHKMSDVR